MAEKKEKTLQEKLIEIQAELKAPKNQYNNFGKFKYRSCEDILEAVKPLLAKANLLLTFTDDIVSKDMRCYIRAAARLENGTHSKEIVAYAREPLSKKGMDEMQISGAASSYARKYALNALFLIDDSKDSDVLEEQKPKEKFQDILDLAYKKFGEKHQLYIEEHDNVSLDYDKFVKAVAAPKPKGFGKLPTVVTAIPQILEKIKLSDVMVETEKTESEAPSEPDKNEFVEQAFFNFTTEHKNDLAEGFVYDMGLFKKAILKHFKKLPTDEIGAAEVIKKIKAVEVLKEL